MGEETKDSAWYWGAREREAVKTRIADLLASFVTKHALIIVLVFAVTTIWLSREATSLRVMTDLTALLSDEGGKWKTVTDYLRHSGYGNRLFVIVSYSINNIELYFSNSSSLPFIHQHFLAY